MLSYLSMIETQEDKEKFEAIYDKYLGLMFHVAGKLLDSHYDVEDAVHQSFLSIIQNLDKISEVDSPKTRSYIVIITERKTIDLIRVQHRDRVTSLEEWTKGLEVPPPGDNGLADAMARLPARYREILLLHYDNGHSVADLARLLGITPSGVRKLLGRSKAQLKTELERAGITL